MSYIYMIQESMTRQFFVGGNVTINGVFTNKKAAIEALNHALYYRQDDLEKHKTYIYWKPDSILAHRYYRIIRVTANAYEDPGLFNIVKGEEVVIFPNAKD